MKYSTLLSNLSNDSILFINTWIIRSFRIIAINMPAEKERQEIMAYIKDRKTDKISCIVLPLLGSGYRPCFFGEYNHYNKLIQSGNYTRTKSILLN